MVTYAIIPRRGSYWLEARNARGARALIEKYGSEQAAVERLRILEAEAEQTVRTKRRRPDQWE